MSPGVPVCVCVRGEQSWGPPCYDLSTSSKVYDSRVGILDHVLFVGENYRIWEGGGLSLL